VCGAAGYEMARTMNLAHNRARSMTYTERFSATELAQVINESFVYMCACPA